LLYGGGSEGGSSRFIRLELGLNTKEFVTHMARLVVIAKGSQGLAHELNGHWTTVGRADGNVFQIVEPSISGRHCEVMLKGDELLVRDLLSTNGTFVAGQKISEAVVKPGETLRLGEIELRFENAKSTIVSGVPFTNSMLLKDHAATPPKTEPAPTKPDPALNAASSKELDIPVEPGRKYSILFVDDSLAFLETFTEMCSSLAKGTWEIHYAHAADRALAILQKQSVDLVVLDIGIPMIDGIQLLGIIGRRYPGMKIAVMTGLATESNRSACLSSGAELFIEKPMSPDGIKAVFNLLNDSMAWADHEGFRGALRQVGLQEIIQMECIGRRSTIFAIRNSQMRGQIYIETGSIVHAAVGNLEGEQAFYKLMSLKGGEFQMKPFNAPPKRTIHGGWELLVMEAARMADEETSFLTKAAAESAAKKPAPEKPPAELIADKPDANFEDDLVVIATYDGQDGQWSPVAASK